MQINVRPVFSWSNCQLFLPRQSFNWHLLYFFFLFLHFLSLSLSLSLSLLSGLKSTPSEFRHSFPPRKLIHTVRKEGSRKETEFPDKWTTQVTHFLGCILKETHTQTYTHIHIHRQTKKLKKSEKWKVKITFTICKSEEKTHLPDPS